MKHAAKEAHKCKISSEIIVQTVRNSGHVRFWGRSPGNLCQVSFDGANTCVMQTVPTLLPFS